MAANPPGQGSHDVAFKFSYWMICCSDIHGTYFYSFMRVFSLSAFPNKARVAILAELEKERKRLIQNPSTGR